MPHSISDAVLVRHLDSAPVEESASGRRRALIGRQDANANVAAWVHVVDVDDPKPHYHRVATELYFVLEGDGSVVLDGREYPVHKESVVHIPPGVVHCAKGRLRLLVMGIPDISEDDLFFAEE